MGINNNLDTLYNIWSAKYSSFIKGGVVDEEWYINAQPKILYILKEVNSQDRNWSLVDLINKQIEERTFLDVWETIALFSLFFTTGFRSYKTTVKNGEFQFNAGYCDALKGIAATNIKKTCGGGQSDWDEIFEYAQKDKALINEEIDIINPDLIICGGTFDILKVVFEFRVMECDSGAQYAAYNNRVYIDMPHPRARVHKKILFSYFRETILELKEKKILIV